LRKKKPIVAVAVLVTVFLFMIRPVAASEPPGFIADEGTVYPGDYYAWIRGSYSSSIWDYVSVSESYGDYYLHGHSKWWQSDTIEYIVIIKIKPADSSLSHVKISVAATFEYGISAGLFAETSWFLEYVVMDMSQSTPYIIGWSEYTHGDYVSNYRKNNRLYSTPTDYEILYDTMYLDEPEEIDPYDWNYIGIRLECKLSNIAYFYRDDFDVGNARFNPMAISFKFYK